MAADLLHFRSLTESVNNIIVPGRVMLERVFTRVMKLTTRLVDMDIIDGNKKLAPFVSTLENGIVVPKSSRTMRSLEAPRIRLETPLRPSDFAERAPGMSVYSNADQILQARKLKIAQEQQILKDMIARRIHWMCCQALTGKITVAQDNIAFEIDFLFPVAYKPVLTSPAVWTHADSDPLANIRAWKRLGQAKGFNYKIGFMTSGAADAFLTNKKVLEYLDKKNVNVGSINRDESDYIGKFEGIHFYEFNEEYTNDAGTSVPMLPANTVTLIDTNARFDMNYAAAEDFDAEGLAVGEMFSKTYMSVDKTKLWMIVESNPLPIPTQIGSVLHATVA